MYLKLLPYNGCGAKKDNNKDKAVFQNRSRDCVWETTSTNGLFLSVHKTYCKNLKMRFE
jgi:phosphoribosyl-AMP cyclohydrolase